jgi:hypothetical protein
MRESVNQWRKTCPTRIPDDDDNDDNPSLTEGDRD